MMMLMVVIWTYWCLVGNGWEWGIEIIYIYIYIHILLAGKEYIISNLAGKSTSARPWSSRSTMQDSLSCHPSRTRRHWGLTALVTEGYQLSARAGTEWTSSPYWRTAPYMDFKTALIHAFTCYLSSCLVWCETKIFSQGLVLFRTAPFASKRGFYLLCFLIRWRQKRSGMWQWHVAASKQAQANQTSVSLILFFILFELQCWSKECGRNIVKRSPACRLTSGWEGACPYNYIVGFVFGGYAGQLGGLSTRPAVGRLPSGAGAWRRAFTIPWKTKEVKPGSISHFQCLNDQSQEMALLLSFQKALSRQLIAQWVLCLHSN